MKTQLIQLDPADDTISVRDKMGWGQTRRVLLVWPEHGQILTRRLDLVLLQRHSAQLGAQLAIATRDPRVREVARELHLSVFDDSRQAQNSRWRSWRRKSYRPKRMAQPPDTAAIRQAHHQVSKSWQEKPAARWLLFGVSMASILALAILFLPSARITLTATEREQSILLPVTASPGYRAINLAGELPAASTNVIVEGRDSLPTTGRVNIPAGSASGQVVFTNLTDQIVRMPAGVIVTTLDAEPVRYATTRVGVVSAGPGRSITLPVQALTPGGRGNLPANRLVAIEGDLGLRVSVTNPDPTQGGLDAPAPSPSATDRQRLVAQLTETLYQSALSDIQNSLPAGNLLLTTTLGVTETLEETFTPAPGLPGSQVSLTLRLEFSALVISAENLNALLLPVLDGSLPDGFAPVADSLSLTHSDFSTPGADGSVTWTIFARRSLLAEISAPEVISLAQGQPAENVSAALAQELPLARAPLIELQPSWWPRLPFVPFRIQVITR